LEVLDILERIKEAFKVFDPLTVLFLWKVQFGMLSNVGRPEPVVWYAVLTLPLDDCSGHNPERLTLRR